LHPKLRRRRIKHPVGPTVPIIARKPNLGEYRAPWYGMKAASDSAVRLVPPLKSGGKQL
jgi:hypothetical protein